jgi:hypothetical protein
MPLTASIRSLYPFRVIPFMCLDHFEQCNRRHTTTRVTPNFVRSSRARSINLSTTSPGVNFASQVSLLPTDNTVRWYWTVWTDRKPWHMTRQKPHGLARKPPEGDLLPTHHQRLGTVLQPTHKAVTQNQNLVICHYWEIGNAEWYGFLDSYTCTNTTPTFPPILEMAVLNKQCQLIV